MCVFYTIYTTGGADGGGVRPQSRGALHTPHQLRTHIRRYIGVVSVFSLYMVYMVYNCVYYCDTCCIHHISCALTYAGI
jgi:hypothetical protein